MVKIGNIVKLVLIFSAILFFWRWLFYYSPDGVYGRTVVVWGDWAIHTTIASVFAYRPVDLWFVQHPLYILGKFSYPFVADAIPGLLMRFGVDLVSAMVISSFATTALLLFKLKKLYARVLAGTGSFLVFLALFVFSGGLGFFINLANPNLSGVTNPIESQGFFTRDLSNAPITPTLFGNILYFQLIPQRALLLGLLVTSIILYYLHSYTQAGSTVNNKFFTKTFLLGLFSGTLAVIHPHSLIALFVCCLALSVLRFRMYKLLIVYAVGTLITFLTLSYFFHDFSEVIGFIKYHPGWLYRLDTKHSMNFLSFWTLNWGLFFPLAIVSTLRYKMYKNFMVVGGWLIFALGNIFLFQPWDWDNTKLFAYSYLFLSFPVSLLLTNLIRGFWYSKLAGTLLFVICIVSGFLDVASIFNPTTKGYRMWSNEDLQIAQSFRDGSDPRSVILTPNAHDNPIAALTGRRLVMGFRATVWSYGFNYYKVENDIESLYRGDMLDSGIVRKYNIDYVVDSGEKRYLRECPIYMRNVNYKVYKIDDCKSN